MINLNKKFSSDDLWDFADKVSNIIALNDVRSTAAAVKAAVDSAVIFERHGVDPTQGDHPGSHGLAIYMPQRSNEYNEKYNKIDFARDTEWDEFIRAYWRLPG